MDKSRPRVDPNASGTKPNKKGSPFSRRAGSASEISGNGYAGAPRVIVDMDTGWLTTYLLVIGSMAVARGNRNGSEMFPERFKVGLAEVAEALIGELWNRRPVFRVELRICKMIRGPACKLLSLESSDSLLEPEGFCPCFSSDGVGLFKPLSQSLDALQRSISHPSPVGEPFKERAPGRRLFFLLAHPLKVLGSPSPALSFFLVMSLADGRPKALACAARNG